MQHFAQCNVSLNQTTSYQIYQSNIPKLNHARTREDYNNQTSFQSANSHAMSSSLYWIALCSSLFCRISLARILHSFKTIHITDSRFSNTSSIERAVSLRNFEQLFTSAINSTLNITFGHCIPSDHHCSRPSLSKSARTFEDIHWINPPSD